MHPVPSLSFRPSYLPFPQPAISNTQPVSNSMTPWSSSEFKGHSSLSEWVRGSSFDTPTRLIFSATKAICSLTFSLALGSILLYQFLFFCLFLSSSLSSRVVVPLVPLSLLSISIYFSRFPFRVRAFMAWLMRTSQPAPIEKSCPWVAMSDCTLWRWRGEMWPLFGGKTHMSSRMKTTKNTHIHTHTFQSNSTNTLINPKPIQCKHTHAPTPHKSRCHRLGKRCVENAMK